MATYAKLVSVSAHPPPEEGTPCPRCGAPFSLADGCLSCGLPPTEDPAEVLRQDRFLAFALRAIGHSDDPLARLGNWRRTVETRLKNTDARPGPPKRAGRAEQLELFDGARDAERTSGAEAETEAPIPTDVVRERAEPAVEVVPPSTPPLAQPSRARRQPREPELSPQELLSRRLEIGVWFVGALLAVGGSLLATRLFWGQLPEAIRPGVVASGLALFAGAFVAAGSVLASRYPGSSAGAVLGLVGRLFALSATVPLGGMRHTSLGTAVGFLALALGLVSGGMALALRREVAGVTRSGSIALLSGMGLLFLAPRTEASAVFVVALSVVLVKVGLSLRADRALGGKSVWLEDTAIVFVGLASLLGACITAAPHMGLEVALVAAGLAWLSDGVVVALESRAMAPGYRALVRAVGALVGSVCVLVTLVPVLEGRGHGYAAFALLALALVVRRPAVFGRSRWLVAPWWGLSTTAVLLFGIELLAPFTRGEGALQGALPIALAWLFVTSFGARREQSRALRPPAFGSALVFASAFVAALVVDDLGRWCAPSLAVVFALLVTDRRIERSVLFNLLAVASGVACVLAALDGLAHFRLLALAVAIGAVGTALLALVVGKRRAPRMRSLAATSALCLALLALGAFGLVYDGLVHDGLGRDAWLPVLLAGGFLLVAGELSRALVLTLGGAGLLWGLALVRPEPFTTEGPLRVAAFGAVVLAALALLPRLRLRPVRLLRRALAPLGHSRYARAGALTLLSVVSASLTLPAVFGGWWRRETPALEASLAMLALALLFVRTRGTVALAGLIAFSVVAAADAGVLVASLHGPAMGSALFALAAVLLWALGFVMLRANDVALPVVRGWRRKRGARIAAAPALWPVVGLLGVAGFALGVAVSPPSLFLHDARSLSLLTLRLAEVLGLGGAVALLLFFVSGRQSLVVTTAVAFALAFAVQAPRVLDAREQMLGLGLLVGLAVYLALVAVLARMAYRNGPLGGPLPGWIEAWPSPFGLRAVAYAGLGGLAAALLSVGGWLKLVAGAERASQFAPGVVILGAAVIGAALVVAARHRVTPALLFVGAVIGATGAAMQLSLRATPWLPPPTGFSQALAAAGLAGLVLLLERRFGRRLLAALGFGYSRRVRAHLVLAATVAACVLVAFSTVRASMGAPTLHLAPIGASALALVALALVAPSRGRAVAGVVGSLLGVACVAAGVLRQPAGTELDLETLPGVLAATIAAALVVERSIMWLASSRLAARIHPGRERALREAGQAARVTARRLGAGTILGQLGICLVAPPTSLVGMVGLGVSLGLAVVLVMRLAYGFSRQRVGHGLLPLVCFATVLAALSLVTGERTLLELMARTEDMLGLVAVAWGLWAALWLVARRSGRLVLATLRFPLPRASRRVLVRVFQGGVVLFAALSLLRGAAGFPFMPVEPTLLVGGVLLALAFLVPTRVAMTLAPVGFAGLVALGAVLAVDVGLGRPFALEVGTAPLALLGVLAVSLLLHTLAPRFFASGAARRFYGVSSTLAAEGAHLQRATELLAGVALFGVIALTAADPSPGALALGCTWGALGVSLVLFSRVAVARERALWAAVAQGAALAVYVDLRRRTPWLDDVYAIDALAALAGAILLVALKGAGWLGGRRAPLARAAEVYAATLPVVAALLGPSPGARALVLAACGGVYAALARSRRHAAYEIGAGLALVLASVFALVHYRVTAPELYLMPIAFVGTFLARRHRARLGVVGRYLAVGSQVPAYVMAAWSALTIGTFAAFALGVALSAAGVVYAFRARDRRSLYAAMAAATVLVVGRLVLAGLDNALLGTLLLVGAGIALLGGMTAFTVKRESARQTYEAWKGELDEWDDP